MTAKYIAAALRDCCRGLERSARVLLFAALTASLCGEACATDLRGKVESKNPHTGIMYGRGGATVTLLGWHGSWVPLRTVYAGPDGLFYLTGVPPGKDYLNVNRLNFPLTVMNAPYQDIPPILVP